MTGSIDPSREQFKAFAQLPDDGPIWMLNMIKLRERAAYPEGYAGATDISGADAYKAYGRESGPIFRRVGGKIHLSGDPKSVLIGPLDETWDIVFVAEYPSAAAFIEMVKDEGYQKIVVHRQAAVVDSRLIRLSPRAGGDGFGR